MIEIKDSAVLRDGDEIGRIEGDTCILNGPIGPSIKGQIRAAADNPDLTFVLGEEAEKKAEPIGFDDGVNRFGIERLMHAVTFGKIPSPPACHPSMGDKDPAFVAWFKLHATAEEFERKFGGRKLPTMEEFYAAEKQKFAKLKDEKTDSGKD